MAKSIDPMSQLRAVRVLLAGNEFRLKTLIEQKTAIEKQIESARSEQRFFEDQELRWSGEVGYAPPPKRDTAYSADGGDSARAMVEAVMEEKQVPVRITDIEKALKVEGTPLKYYTIRTVLQRGYERGRYSREGHLYSLISQNSPPPSESEAELPQIDEEDEMGELFSLQESNFEEFNSE